jgi:hypothetical protein
MIKKIIPIIMLLILSISVLGATLTRTVPSTVQPGQTFTVSYTASGVSGNYFITLEDSVLGGCTPNLIKQVQSNSASFSTSVTAPNSGFCTFSGTGYILTGNTEEKILSPFTVTVSSSPSCTTGQIECLSSTTYKECLTSTWSGTKTCASGQTCIAGTGCTYECTTGSKVCTDSTHYKYCSNNVWQTPMSCPTGQLCENGECYNPNSCVTGTKECLTDYTYKECIAGEWSNSINCGVNKVCSGGSCVDSTSACTSGVKECIGTDKYRTCTNGVWESSVSCGTGKECTGAGLCTTINDDDEETTIDEEDTCPNDNALVNMFADLFTSKDCNKAKDYVKYASIFFVLIILLFIFKQFI